MANRRLALVTCDRLPSLFGDEAALPAAFARAGIDARPVSWSDAAVDWTAFDLVVLRSPWDYFERIAEFTAWLDRLERAHVRLCNPLPLVRWNLDKRYLRELSARGVRIVPTEFVEAPANLAALVAGRGWREAILKPAISGGSHRTHRFAAADAAAHQGELDALVRDSAALVQPYLREIVDEGEWSLLFFAGELSHAVLKRPAAGDFRVQAQFGGRAELVTPPPSLLADARAVVAALPLPPTYVRIDGVRQGDALVLMEVEALEPYLFMQDAPAAVERYVAAVASAARAA